MRRLEELPSARCAVHRRHQHAMLELPDRHVGEPIRQHRPQPRRIVLGRPPEAEDASQPATPVEDSVSLLLEQCLQFGSRHFRGEPQGQHAARGGAADEIEVLRERPTEGVLQDGKHGRGVQAAIAAAR